MQSNSNRKAIEHSSNQSQKTLENSIDSINRKPIERLNSIDSAANRTSITFDWLPLVITGTFTECVQTILSSEKPYFKVRFLFLSPPHNIIQAPPLPPYPSALSPRSTILENFDHMTRLKSRDWILAVNVLYQVPKLSFGFHKPATFYEVTPRKNEEETQISCFEPKLVIFCINLY